MPRAATVFNGKFLSAAPTGVHRVAGELVENLDRLLTREVSSKEDSWLLACPRDADAPLSVNAIDRQIRGLTTWQPWEQFELPWIARDALLVNLCNIGPLAQAKSITMIHDAQVFLTPESYSRGFLAWYRFALPRIGHAAARVLTVSQFSAERLVEFGVTTREKIVVIHNGIDHLLKVATDETIFERLGLRAGTYVVAAANIQKHKNVAILFKAFSSPALSHLRLVLVGSDTAADFAAAGTAVPPQIVFAGRVSDGALRALYENAACLAFPSLTEGFGLPPVEAMAMGCPTVVAPCGALPEVCGDAALYAAPDDPRAWVESIARVSARGETRDRAKGAGRDRSNRYRWDNSARRLLDVIRTVQEETLCSSVPSSQRA